MSTHVLYINKGRQLAVVAHSPVNRYHIYYLIYNKILLDRGGQLLVCMLKTTLQKTCVCVRAHAINSKGKQTTTITLLKSTQKLVYIVTYQIIHHKKVAHICMYTFIYSL